MKRIILLGILFTLLINAKTTDKCTGCHGKLFEISALGKSGIVRDMPKDKILESIYGYKKGTLDKYGLGALMKGQVFDLSDKEIEEIIDEIKSKKKVKIKKLLSCQSIPKLTKNEVLNVIKNGSHRYNCPMGVMPPEMAKGAEASNIANFLVNGMHGKQPKSFDACTSCHGNDGKGMDGMSPDISHFGKDVKASVDINKVKTNNKGKWILDKEISQIDDSVNVTLYLQSEDSIQTQFKQTVKPSLILRCSENKTNTYINWDIFLGIDSTQILLRLDKNKATNERWSISTNNKAVFANKDIPFIKNLMKHNKLLAQITPYGESPVMTTFDIRGLKDMIKPLRKACGW